MKSSSTVKYDSLFLLMFEIIPGFDVFLSDSRSWRMFRPNGVSSCSFGLFHYSPFAKNSSSPGRQMKSPRSSPSRPSSTPSSRRSPAEGTKLWRIPTFSHLFPIISGDLSHVIGVTSHRECGSEGNIPSERLFYQRCCLEKPKIAQVFMFFWFAVNPRRPERKRLYRLNSWSHESFPSAAATVAALLESIKRSWGWGEETGCKTNCVLCNCTFSYQIKIIGTFLHVADEAVKMVRLLQFICIKMTELFLIYSSSVFMLTLVDN